MKTKLLTIIGCLLMTAAFTFGQTQMITFDATGTNNTSITVNAGTSFGIDTYATFTGFTGAGLSYWLQVPNALAPYISITNETYFTWTDPNQTFFVSDPFNQTAGADSGFTAEDRDLGGTSIFSGGNFVQAQPAGTYKVSTVTFSLAANAPAGTYTMMSTLGGGAGKNSEISDTSNGHHLVQEATFTITVVPEPATLSLLGLGGLGSFGLTMLRARRKS